MLKSPSYWVIPLWTAWQHWSRIKTCASW